MHSTGNPQCPALHGGHCDIDAHNTKPFEFIQAGDFISIPAWSIEGQQVIATEKPITGSEQAQRVLVQSSPCDELGRWYTVEPSEFSLET